MPRTSMNTSAKRKQNCNRATLLFSYLTHFINPPSWNNHIPFFYVQNFHPDACNEQNRAPPIKCISMTLINEQNCPLLLWVLIFEHFLVFNTYLTSVFLYISLLLWTLLIYHMIHICCPSLFYFYFSLDVNWILIGCLN